MWSYMALKTASVSLALLSLVGCTGGPTINLGTKQPLKVDPVKVDLNMRVDVYQHADPTVQKKVVATQPTGTEDAQTRLRNRMGEVQVLKNNRIVGESSKGFLNIQNQPPGEFGDYVQRTVEAENKDRLAMMQDIAQKKNLAVEEVQRQQAELARNKAFNGEWIELPQPDGTLVWKQKGM
jgi:uncharacterized protein YdbL (DUF1318 family)